MKYTRYNYGGQKKTLKGRGVMIIFTILILAILIGTLLSKFVIKGNIKDSIIGTQNSIKEEEKEAKVQGTLTQTKIYTIQCGYFSKKENAEEVLGKIKAKHGGFLVEDGGKFRVFTGIYEGASVEGKLKELTSEGISGMKAEVNIKKSGEYYNEIYAMIVEQIKLLNRLDDANIKSINTDEFKKWVEGIKVPKESDGSFKVFNDMKNICINSPKDLTKEKSGEIYKGIYGVIKGMQ